MTTHEAVEHFNPVQFKIFKRKVDHTCSLGYRYLDRMNKKRWNECVKHANALTISVHEYLIGLKTPELTEHNVADVLRVLKDAYFFKAWVVHFVDNDEMKPIYNDLMSTIADIEQSLSTSTDDRFVLLFALVTCALEREVQRDAD